MALGLRSMAAFWIGGIAAGTAAPVICPCPEYGHEATLSDLSKTPETLANTAERSQSPISGTYRRQGCN
jgi:hypothetical protein